MSGVQPTQIWRHLVASPEWAQLQATLQATPGGGPAIAAILTRLAPAPAAHQALVAALQEAAWEKIHLGTWREVGVMWRDVYTLGCLLAALQVLAAGEDPHGHAPAVAMQPAEAAGAGEEGGPSAEALAAALRHVDMAALMGGPLFRPLVDALAEELAKRWNSMHEAEAPPGGQAPAGEEEDDLCWGAVDVPLPPDSLGPRGAPVCAHHLPSLHHFAAEFMSGGAAGRHGRPVLITGALEGWPALQRWRRPSYLRAAAGPRVVPVEVGGSYLQEGWGQRLMPFSQFLDTHVLPKPGGAQADRLQGYLAQHALLDQIPALAADVHTPEYCALGGEVRAVNAWLGPAGTVTPAHTDPYHNLLCQVAGRKYVRLYAPDQGQALYPYPEGLTTNSSQVDLDAPDLDAFPLLAAAPFVDCVVEPGSALYVPPGWWHYVKALTPSFSVSFWWEGQ